MDKALAFKFFNLAGVAAPNTSAFQLRVIDDQEQANVVVDDQRPPPVAAQGQQAFGLLPPGCCAAALGTVLDHPGTTIDDLPGDIDRVTLNKRRVDNRIQPVNDTAPSHPGLIPPCGSSTSGPVAPVRDRDDAHA